MATWWTSDTHFSHANTIHYCDRPSVDVDEMNAELIRTRSDRDSCMNFAGQS